MENNRVFSTLIEQLEDVLRVLQCINDNKLWTESLIKNESLRMHLKMKNVISTLVRKTTNGKCPWEDLAKIDKEKDEFSEKQIFENHITSEEYIAESVKVHNARPEVKVLLNCLLSLQELLGDILDSSCQISNCCVKLTSGVFVHDLITIHQQYKAIWQFLSSIINPRKENLAQTEGKTFLTEENLKLLRSVQSTFKELTKMKLEIEHYFRVNLIEIEFGSSKNGPNDIFNNYIPHADCAYLPDMKTDLYKAHLYENSLAENSSTEFTENSFGSSETIDLPSNLLTRSSDEQRNNRSHLLASMEPRVNVKKEQNNCANQDLMYPMNILHFHPPLFIKSNIGNLINEQNSKIIQLGNDFMEEKLCTTDHVSYNNYQVMQNLSKDNGGGKDRNNEKNERGSNENVLENLVSERIGEKSNAIEERGIASESSLGQHSINKKDLFVTTPLTMEKSNDTYSVVEHNDVNLNHRKNNLEAAHIYEQLKLISTTRNVHQSKFVERPGTLCQFDSALNEDKNVIFDHESLIEIFKANKVKNNTTSEPTEEENSSFCLWPVAANYIYVSNPRKGNSSECSSYTSDRRSEMSLEPIYLNCRYENEDDYDSSEEVNELRGDDNTFKDSLAAYKSDKQVVTNTKITNPIFNGTFNTFSAVQNTNFKCFTRGIQQLNNSFIQKTMAVQFSHCEDSFMVKKERYTKENLKMLNGRSYTNDLNSFISIFTSNVSADGQLNHRKIFRRAMNSYLGRRAFPRDNQFNNTQTLKSNSGPYRLFDINGYPLTDTAGNVLKDPYGKCLVELDLMGLPKDDGKIFDAAGNAPKDVNFDPTQKPKTSTIILKLTDNMKRPLHLFDKYGRPLTDSYGKLLVSIHGRPLLRFDDFGQPKTDYRGGPLFTENGFKWSPNNTRSQEELLKGNKVVMQLQNNPYVFLGSIDNENSGKDSSESKSEDYANKEFNGNGENINTLSSDIWSQLEMVLTKLPKKKKLAGPSKESIIVNNVSVLQSSLEQDMMKSTIHLDNNFAQEELNKININEKFSNNMSSNYVDDFLHGKKRVEKTNGVACESKKNYEVNTTSSKGLLHDVLAHRQGKENNMAVINYNNCGDGILLGGMSPTIVDNINVMKGQVSLNEHNTCKKSQKHRNQHSLFNFSNDIFHANFKTNQQKNDSPLYSIISKNGRSDSTDFSQSQSTSAGTSKYTTDILTSSESPMIMIDSSAQGSNQLEKLQDCNNYSRENGRLDLKNIKQTKKNDFTHSKNYDECPKNRVSLIDKMDCDKCKRHVRPLKRALTVSQKLKYNKMLYEQKLADIILQSFEGDGQKEEFKTIQLQKDLMENEKPVRPQRNSEKRLKEKYDDHEEHNRNEIKNSEIEPERINKLTDQRQNMYHSPFRFGSESSDNEANNFDDNIEVKYIRGEDGEVTSDKSVNVLVKDSVKNVDFSSKALHGDKFQQITKDKSNPRFVSIPLNQNHSPANKIDQLKNKIYQKKYIHTSEKVTPVSKECNLVTFLGGPVRYVLNKLDLTRSSKQKPNTMNREPKNINKQHTLPDYNRGVNNQYKNQKKYNIEHYKKEIPEKLKQKKYIDKKQILAFRSKSCIEISNKNVAGKMSYSGNEDNTNSPNMNEGKLQVRRFSSDISHYFERYDGRSIKNEDDTKNVIVNKLKINEPRPYKIIYPRKRNTAENHKVIKKLRASVEKGKKISGPHYRKK